MVAGSIPNGSWVGIIDANSALNSGHHLPVWNIDCRITKASQNAFVDVVLFPVEKLKKVVFKNKKYGRDIEQTLEALWLEDNCQHLAKVSF